MLDGMVRGGAPVPGDKVNMIPCLAYLLTGVTLHWMYRWQTVTGNTNPDPVNSDINTPQMAFVFTETTSGTRHAATCGCGYDSSEHTLNDGSFASVPLLCTCLESLYPSSCSAETSRKLLEAAPLLQSSRHHAASCSHTFPVLLVFEAGSTGAQGNTVDSPTTYATPGTTFGDVKFLKCSDE